jgi:hypothetical protein
MMETDFVVIDENIMAEICMALTKTMPSLIPLFSFARMTSGVMLINFESIIGLIQFHHGMSS